MSNKIKSHNSEIERQKGGEREKCAEKEGGGEEEIVEEADRLIVNSDVYGSQFTHVLMMLHLQLVVDCSIH